VENTGAPIQMPVGREVLGRILNVVGEPVDERGPVTAKSRLPIDMSPRHFASLSKAATPIRPSRANGQ